MLSARHSQLCCDNMLSQAEGTQEVPANSSGLELGGVQHSQEGSEMTLTLKEVMTLSRTHKESVE